MRRVAVRGARADGPRDPRIGSAFRDRTCAQVAGHDAPPIGERAPTRGRVATEGGGERVCVRRAVFVRAPTLVGHARADRHTALFATAFHAALCGRSDAELDRAESWRVPGEAEQLSREASAAKASESIGFVAGAPVATVYWTAVILSRVVWIRDRRETVSVPEKWWR